MRIACYAPLKSPDHPVPSGDRLMARLLRAALQAGGHDVALVSGLRSYCGDPEDRPAAAAIAATAATERHRLAAAWQRPATERDRPATERHRLAAAWRQGPPDVWVCYHPYYKSPDLIGPPLCRAFGVPYVTIETSYSARRNLGVWVASQAAVLDGMNQAAVNICLTARDRAGIAAAAPTARLADLPPFIDAEPFAAAPAVTAPFPPPHCAHDGPVRLITVAMMRAGDKFASYTLLAQALARLTALDWRLTIVGAGAMQAQVRALFGDMHDRVQRAGLCDPAQVAGLLAQSDIYLWPGFGEAYGLAYLEAQAAGLPVVAQNVAGVPEVVTQGSGLLTPAGDVAAYAAGVAGLIADAGLRRRMGGAARERVLARHSFQAATARLNAILTDVIEAQR